MPRTGLVGDIAHYGRLVDKATDECPDIREITAAVVAHVNDKSLSIFQEEKHVVKVALTDRVGEGLVLDIADVLRQDAEKHTGALAVIEVEI